MSHNVFWDPKDVLHEYFWLFRVYGAFGENVNIKFREERLK
jgi:hypothetical protein